MANSTKGANYTANRITISRVATPNYGKNVERCYKKHTKDAIKMSQEQIYNLLKKHKKPLSVSQISLKLNLSKSPITYSLKRLEKWGEIKVVKECRLKQQKKREVKCYKIR